MKLIEPTTAETVQAQKLLEQLGALLETLNHPRTEEVKRLAQQISRAPSLVWRAINGNDWWAGAGSLAADTMSDNPGLPPAVWEQEVRRFRRLLIELGQLLTRHGEPNPGLGSWLLAFENWNASEV